jgi:hypothetical protein
MMTSHPTSRPARFSRVRRLARAGVIAAALGMGAAVFAHPIVARADYDDKYFKFCVDSIGQGVAYCCAHAGGVVSGGGCVDPANQESSPIISKRNTPPIIIVPVAPRP